MNKEEEPICSINHFGTQSWWLNNEYHKLDGPARILPDGVTIWRIHGKTIYTTSLEELSNLSIGQSINWKNNSIALIIKQINPILYKVLLGNQKKYLFSLFNSQYKDTAYWHNDGITKGRSLLL